MYCKNCGNEIKGEEKFCGKCGNKIEIEVKTNTTTNNADNKKNLKVKPIYIVIGIIVVIFVIALGISMSNNNSSVIESASSTSNTSTKNTANSKLDLNNVQMNTVFTSLSDMNSVTKKVANCALSYLNYFYPNFNWSNMQIKDKDGYGRYWVVVNYVKSSASEKGNVAGIMVWIKDINDDNKMGFYYSGGVAQKSNGWGTPLPDNIGE